MEIVRNEHVDFPEGSTVLIIPGEQLICYLGPGSFVWGPHPCKCHLLVHLKVQGKIVSFVLRPTLVVSLCDQVSSVVASEIVDTVSAEMGRK